MGEVGNRCDVEELYAERGLATDATVEGFYAELEMRWEDGRNR